MSININQNFKSLKGSVQIVAQAMAASSGVKVVWGNYATAYIQETGKSNRKVIHLPNLPANDENAKILTWGYLTHELAHENYTDFSVAFPTHPTKIQMFRVLEDVRIEIKSSSRYPGSKINLQRLIKSMVDANEFMSFAPGLNPSQLIVGYTSTVLRSDLLEQSTTDLSIKYEDELKTAISKGTLIKLNSLIYTVSDCDTTSDVYDLVEHIFNMLEDEKKDEEEQQQNQNAQDQSGASGSSSGNDESEGNSEGSEDENSQDEAKSNCQSNDSDGDDSSGSSSASQDENGEQDSSGSSSKSAGGNSSTLPSLESILNGTDSIDESDLGAIISEKLNELSKDGQMASVSPMTKAKLPLGLDPKTLSDVKSASNATKQRVVSLLEAKARTKVIHRSSGPAINPKRITRVISGDFTIFDKKTIGIKQNTAIQILLDISGSMSGGNDILAAQAGLSVALALDNVKGLNSAVAAFPYQNSVLELTSFSERTSGTTKRYTNAIANGGTPMSEAILTVAYDLLNQPNDRKLLLVITDGLPNNVLSCEQVIQSVSDMGIEFIGLGIGQVLPAFFKVSKSISSINELPSAMFEILKQQMLKVA